MEVCYIARKNTITSSNLTSFRGYLQRFHETRKFFLDSGICKDFSLPRQHSLIHYEDSIRMFGAPNGLCSSITESKHIKAVKEPWRRSSRYNALKQMVRTILRLDKMAALRRKFEHSGMLAGTTSSYTADLLQGGSGVLGVVDGSDHNIDDDDKDVGPLELPRDHTSIRMSQKKGRVVSHKYLYLSNHNFVQHGAIQNGHKTLQSRLENHVFQRSYGASSTHS
ncbi:hypothetical protein PQX77_002593 [Marasmius sp. AFHP31]|nr:hypothetical protein PQX77_002593 [Marasmius sp. AFHP31]